MGNIEIKDRPKKQNTIFGQRNRQSSRSPFRDALSPKSPHYRNYSPIRYSPLSQNRRSDIKESLATGNISKKSQLSDPKRKLEPFIQKSFKKHSQRIQEQNIDINAENKEKCEQIIRKVRNFNDFLVELRRKIKQDSMGEQQRPKADRGEVSLSLRLQNQRVELQKYKRLVERELSKTHSIQNISIQNASNGEKILTIHYEDLQNTGKKIPPNLGIQTERAMNSSHNYYGEWNNGESNANEEQEDKNNSSLSVRLMDISKNNNESSVSKQSGYNHQKRVKEAKALWEILNKKANELAERLAKEEENLSGGDELKNYLQLKQRIIKANEICNSLESAVKHSVQVERRVKELLT